MKDAARPAPQDGRPGQQIDSLTALRGVLAVWVVLYHFWNELLVLFPAAGWLTPVCRHGHFAVPGFFALSAADLKAGHARHRDIGDD